MSAIGPFRSGLLGMLFAVSLASAPSRAAELVRVGGTGMALATMRQISDSLRAVAPDVVVEVLPSLGTSGALRALKEHAIDIAVAARTLEPEERTKGFVEATCLRTALLFASSHPSPGGIRSTDLPRLYTDPAPLWPDGRHLKILMRSRAGSENAYLAAYLPAMKPALERAYGRPGVPVATTDQENAELAVRTEGSFAVMTLLQLRSEHLDLRPVAVDGVVPDPATVADGSYPLSVVVCAVTRAVKPPAVTRVVTHLRSETGRNLIRSLGATPLE
ncbi:substrate-binding domain-containing protein [Rhodoplanes roseus]|uniref:PBP domain-containing protein n=1 Tax=Rhodoplanes roseus TaxID=29409 RepID=A0A327KYF1_9BRAD|nr:substrate-binding domain-containing protein [Rhodoplanes roseus]RAI43054.1 hypothetical protein CH341_16290 [Rhodoplanes roseus]